MDIETDTLDVSFNVLMRDGIGYILSNTKCEITSICESEFARMVDEHSKKQDAVNSILLPGRDFNI